MTAPAHGVFTGTGTRLGRYSLQFPLEERTILRALAEQGAVRPEKPWLIFDGADVLTYGQAYRDAHLVADAVRDTVGTGRHVGLLMRNQREFMPTELGAMLCPGIAVPLNAEMRGPLLESVIRRMDVDLLVVRDELLEVLEPLELGGAKLVVVTGDRDPPASVAGVPVERWGDWLAGRDPDPADFPLPRHDELALIALTSGTTGEAKGVVHTHHYWYLISSVVADSLEREETDILTTPLPMYHGAGANLVANSALQSGCTAHLQTKFSASRFWATAARDGANHAFLLGALASLVRKATTEVPEHRVETIYCLPAPPDREGWEQAFGTRILSQGWGMTEIFPVPMQRRQLQDVPVDTIGYPADWTDYAVVDESGSVVPPGVVGELVWRSRIPYGMFSEYYREPELTLRAFRNLWFHSGDAASYEADGMLRFRGRLRDRIRRRGELVNASEIEQVAVLHPAIREAAAYGVPSPFGEEDVKLDLVLDAYAEPGELFAWLEENLPRFMVPRYLEILAEFPKTPTGRIEKYKLSSQPIDRPEVKDMEAVGTR
jgi:crotonobetaine/carnitine-CoA ligase